MGLIRNLLALIGLLVVAGLIYMATQMGSMPKFSKDAGATYWNIAKKLMETGNIADATVWKKQVQEGMSAEEVEEIIKFVANERNIKGVGELPLYKEVASISGEDYRFLKIYMYCNPMTAAKMVDYSDAFSAYLPCRISMVEDKEGKLWLYTLNMDMMIHGGTELPEELHTAAVEVKDTMLDIMERASTGDF